VIIFYWSMLWKKAEKPDPPSTPLVSYDFRWVKAYKFRDKDWQKATMRLNIERVTFLRTRMSFYELLHIAWIKELTWTKNHRVRWPVSYSIDELPKLRCSLFRWRRKYWVKNKKTLESSLSSISIHHSKKKSWRPQLRTVLSQQVASIGGIRCKE
jgi:hypothetical protein